jgi:Smg protein
MKQTAVDVLMYLFENFIEDETAIDPHRHELLDELEQVGFPLHEIRKAFTWLEDLIEVQDSMRSPRKTTSTRIFSDLEKQLLDTECLGFIMHLEDGDILTPATRELVLDRVIALDVELDMEQLKWIVMIVLYNHPGEENAYAWMESMVFEQNVNYMH